MIRCIASPSGPLYRVMMPHRHDHLSPEDFVDRVDQRGKSEGRINGGLIDDAHGGGSAAGRKKRRAGLRHLRLQAAAFSLQPVTFAAKLALGTPMPALRKPGHH